VLTERDEAHTRAIVETFVPGREYAVEGVLTGGRFDGLAVFEKPDPLDGPFFEETLYVTPTRLAGDAQQALARVAADAARAIGLVEGPVHVELRWNESGAWLIELGARPIGGRCSAALRFMTGGGRGEKGEGLSLEDLVVAHALGLALPSLAREPQASGVMMIPVPGRGGMLRAVRGVAEARAVPGVDDVAITATGQRLVPWPEGDRYTGFIFARGARPEDVETALRDAHARLRFDVDPDD